MKLHIVALAVAALVVAASAAQADPGKNAPGHMMQKYGSATGHPGASDYAPGHLKHHRSTVGFAVHHRNCHHH